MELQITPIEKHCFSYMDISYMQTSPSPMESIIISEGPLHYCNTGAMNADEFKFVPQAIHTY